MDDHSLSSWEFEEDFAAMSGPKILLYLIRRDIRLSDNPVFHEVVKSFSGPSCRFTHVLPVYVFTASQVETSGLFTTKDDSPFPEARSRVGGFWRCGPHRAKFLGGCVWDLQESLQKIGSDLSIRAGHPDQVVQDIIEVFSKPGTPTSGSENSSVDSGAKGQVVEVWMTEEKTTEEKTDEKKIKRVTEEKGINFRLFKDEKYFIDEFVTPSCL
jgi:deoxyribodipyrimidine photo-lyase